MFVTIANIAQHVSDSAGQVLLMNPAAKVATAHEAACCVSRLVYLGNAGMHEANDDFKRIYGTTVLKANEGENHD